MQSYWNYLYLKMQQYEYCKEFLNKNYMHLCSYLMYLFNISPIQTYKSRVSYGENYIRYLLIIQSMLVDCGPQKQPIFLGFAHISFASSLHTCIT